MFMPSHPPARLIPALVSDKDAEDADCESCHKEAPVCVVVRRVNMSTVIVRVSWNALFRSQMTITTFWCSTLCSLKQPQANWTHGLFIIMCGCKRKRMLGFFLMERHESVRTVFEFVYRHFKVAPRVIVYDNGTPVLLACVSANRDHRRTNPVFVTFGFRPLIVMLVARNQRLLQLYSPNMWATLCFDVPVLNNAMG